MTMLENKAVVVTGAGAGLGRAYALAASAAGAAVVANDIDENTLETLEEEVRARGGSIEVVPGSVADWSIAESLPRRCLERFGSFDGIVNNAAVFHVLSPSEETADSLRRITEVNVLGSAFVALNAFTAMAAQGHGVIINVISGAHIGIKGMTAYGMTKGAVASLTYNLALEAADTGVRVVALSPVAQTGMGVGVGPRADGIERPQPTQIAPVVIYLLSDLADQLNGQVVRYDSHTISLMSLPHFRTTRVSENIDTPEGIAAAFDAALKSEIQPIGLY